MSGRVSAISMFAMTLAGLALAAGCSGNPSGGSPFASAIPGAFPVTAAIPDRVRRRTATDVIGISVNVPSAPSHLPKVLAIGVELDGSPKTFVGFDLKAAGACKAANGGGFACLLDVHALPGLHSMAVTGYNAYLDGHKPKGGSLVSTNQVPVNVADAHVPLSLAFYSLTTSIAVLRQSDAVTGSASTGFKVDRHAQLGAAPFALITRDASGKYVVGPASPSFTISASNAQFAIAQPSQNEFTIGDSSTAASKGKLEITSRGKTSPSCPNACKLAVNVSLSDDGTGPTPSPSPSPTTSPSPSASPSVSPSASPTSSPSGPPTTPGPTPTPVPTPLAFVSYSTASGGAIRAFTLQGTLVTSWTVSVSASTLAFDSSNGYLYAVTNGAASPITAYDHSGNVQTLSPGFSSLGTVTSIAYDSNNNELYVAAANTIKAYDAQGNLQLGSGFSSFTSTTPGGLTFDAANRSLYVIDGTNVEQWSEAGVKGSASGFAAPSGCNTAGCVPTALVFNPPGLDWLYAVWSDGTKTAMACWVGSGGGCHFAASSPFSTIDQPQQIGYDPVSADVFVASLNGISVWGLEGNSISTSGFPGGAETAINGIAIGH